MYALNKVQFLTATLKVSQITYFQDNHYQIVSKGSTIIFKSLQLYCTSQSFYKEKNVSFFYIL